MKSDLRQVKKQKRRDNMGWTYGKAKYWKNGQIDRKAECDALCTQEEHDEFPQLRVLKSRMVGSIYYAAVECSYPKTQKKETYVFGSVILTKVNWSDFGYKVMDETVCPYAYDCPESILKMLSPTDCEWANEWRSKCRQKAQVKDIIKKCPIGTRIRFKLNDGVHTYYKHAPAFQFNKPFWMCEDGSHYIKVNHIPMDFEVLEGSE